MVRQHFPQSTSGQAGQALILIVVLIGGIFMVITAVAGLLTFYQLQEAGDAGRSTEAVLAADAGLERTLRFFYTLRIQVPEECFVPNPPCGSNIATLYPEFSALDGSLPNSATYQGFMRFWRDVPRFGDITITMSATGRDRTSRSIRTLQTTFVQHAGTTAP